MLNQANALLQAAKSALPYFHNTHDFPTLQAEVNSICELINLIKSAGGSGKEVKKMSLDLNKHIHSLSMLLFKLKHMHPIPIEPPKHPDNPWSTDPPEGDGGDFL